MVDYNFGSGPHWSLLEWTVLTPVKLYNELFDRFAPTEEDITNLRDNLGTLTSSLNETDEIDAAVNEQIIERVNRTYGGDQLYNYASVSGFLKRGSVYHGMKKHIEAGKGNTSGAIGHSLKRLGYNVGVFTEILGLMGMSFYALAGGAICVGIDTVAFTIKYLTEPGLVQSISNIGSRTKEEVGYLIDDMRERRELRQKVNKRFYQIVDNEI